MTHLSFYEKYRPTQFDQLIIDSDIVSAVKKMTENHCLNFLFVGDIGSGKSTIINVIVNEYFSGNTEHNIMNINNLNERGIQFYRNDIFNFCKTYTTVVGKKKLVVIDNIDEIPKSSQHVFRMLIDKCSSNAQFIFTCSSLLKVIDSIQSRLNIISLPRCSKIQVEKVVRHISKCENILLEPPAMNFLIAISEPFINVAINYLEKIKLSISSSNNEANNVPFTLLKIEQICTGIEDGIFSNYFYQLKMQHLHDAIKIIQEIYDRMFSISDIINSFFQMIKTDKLDAFVSEHEKYKITTVLAKYVIIINNNHDGNIEIPFITNDLMMCFSDNK
jgi:DNA polymerase III delta prime subunit